MVEISVIVPTTLPDDADVLSAARLASDDFEDYEVLIQREGGAAHARNVGIERARGDKLVFLDDDSIPCAGYLRVASVALDAYPAVAGRVFQPDDAPFADLDLPWYDQGDESKPTDMLPGCNMAIRREVLDEVGGFDAETFGWGHEESELAERIAEAYTIQYVPELVVEHTYVESFRHFLRKSYLLGRADVQWWRLDGKSRYWLVRQWFNTPIRGESRLETARRVAQRAGWFAEILDGR
ncbi:glycosyltransferase family 2 protein [Halococcus salsus]|uniref:glycosyltransferase family 2 protein n=1 Tax=Halococcus salsus TaxID=2162894 RepID=UPI001357B70C|nr:galactosyltransferase-related protein [Halococcus salsus]